MLCFVLRASCFGVSGGPSGELVAVWLAGRDDGREGEGEDRDGATRQHAGWAQALVGIHDATWRCCGAVGDGQGSDAVGLAATTVMATLWAGR